MDPSIFAASGGVVIGLIAGAAGSYRGIRDAKPGAERRYVLLWSAAFTLGIASFLAGVCLLPRPFFWLLGGPLLVIVMAVYAVNRGRAERHPGRQQGDG
jgi:hypothetical protein